MHKLIYPFGKALCTKCGMRPKSENEQCGFAFLPDDFTGEPAERHGSDKRDDKVFTQI